MTRTISLKIQTKELKIFLLKFLKDILLSNYKLKNNTSGSKIDYCARKYLKQIGLNYAHGTGHGVGYYLNVHEGPQAISKKNKIIYRKEWSYLMNQVIMKKISLE